MLKKQILGSLLGLLYFSGLSSQPFDWYSVRASHKDSMTDLQIRQIYKELISNDYADLKNVAIVEHLLKKIDKKSYDYCITKPIDIKANYLDYILRDRLGSYDTKHDVVALPPLPPSPVASSGSLGFEDESYLNELRAKTGFTEEVFRQRVLNNVAVLERLLVILGQSYAESANSSLFDKQQVLKSFGTTNSLLKILVENGYTPDQLILIVKNSNEIMPSKVKSHYGPITSSISTNAYIPREQLSIPASSISLEPVTTNYPFSAHNALSEEAYQYYMNRIKTISPLAYNRLTKCAEVLGSPCIRKQIKVNLDRMMAPSDATKGYPIMSFPYNLDDLESDEVLTSEVNEFNIRYAAVDAFFSVPEYNQLMSIIKENGQDVYESLKNCELKLGRPCLIKGDNYNIYAPQQYTDGYPIIQLSSLISSLTDAVKKNFLEIMIPWYKRESNLGFTDLTQADRNHILNILESVAPSFYKLLIAVDPTGEHHILASDSTGVICGESGLPLIHIDSKVMSMSPDMQRFVLGHELGHFVLHHVVISPQAFKQKYLATTGNDDSEKIGHLSPKKAFKNSYIRQQEYEADRFAVVNLGVPIADGVAYMKDAAIQDAIEEDMLAGEDIDGSDSDSDSDSEDDDSLYKEIAKRPIDPKDATFMRTHPLWGPRIAHLESLAPEVELCRQGRIPCGVDWDKAIKSCLGQGN